MERNLNDVDPTAYSLGGNLDQSDPRVRRLDAYANHGWFRLRMPYMTEIAPNLWQGGVGRGLILPDFVDYQLSLFKWESYDVRHELKESRTVTMFDSLDQEFDEIPELSAWVNERRKLGPVFVHCQAGLNRSSLVVAKALLDNGDVQTGQEAIDLIRERRDPACLCNPAFEKWVRELAAGVA
jgi:protein-tyrosine phosphatase